MKRTLVDDCFRAAQPTLRHAQVVDTLKAIKLPKPSISDVALYSAAGRVLAAEIVAGFPVPGHTNSAVDGYAFAASPQILQQGAVLAVSGRAAAGNAFDGPADLATAVRIFTGAVLPSGFDTVVMQEDVERFDDGPVPSVRTPPGLKRGANVRAAGEDVATGAILYKPGDTLRAHDLAALASIGLSSVRCYNRIRIAIASTGDEIVAPGGGPLRPGQVYDANTPMLCALAQLAGTEVTRLGIWPDSRNGVKTALTAAARDFDVILTSGGASLGEEDHMASVLGEIGQRHVWQIDIKPGRPLMFGQIRSGDRDAMIVGLPGNPVAAFVCFLMYVYPLLRAVSGAPWREPRRFKLRAAFAVTGRKLGRREFWRGRLSEQDGCLVAGKFPRDGSGLISGLSWSDGLIEIPEDTADVVEGQFVDFIPYSEFGGL